MRDTILKIYTYPLIIISVASIIIETLNYILKGQILSLNILFGVISGFESILLLGSIGMIIYLFYHKFKLKVTILPLVHLFATSGISGAAAAIAFREMNFFSMYRGPNTLIWILESILYIFLIIYSIYIIKLDPVGTKKLKKNNKKSKTLGVVAIVSGVIAFIPALGFLFGVIAIILGIINMVKNKSRLGLIGIILGALGMLLWGSIYGFLFYQLFKEVRGEGGIFQGMQEKDIKTHILPSTINAIEAYKLRYGSYPQRLMDITESEGDQWLYQDPLNIGTDDWNFYYENKGDYYFIFSRGKDGEPFTEDDIFADIGPSAGEMGYRVP